jgi:hypothetical protein
MLKRYLLLLLAVSALIAVFFSVMQTSGSREVPASGDSVPSITPTSPLSTTVDVAIVLAATPMATLTPTPEPTATPPPRSGQYRVGLQIGHYKIKEVPDELEAIRKQWGTYGGGRNEDEVAMDVATRTAALLEVQGVLVELLPAAVPGGYTADAFVSLHADGASSLSKRGFKVATRWASYVAEQDARLVEMIYEEYAPATGLPQNYEINDNMRDYYSFAPWRNDWRVSNLTPSALIEMGYMTHPADREILFYATDKAASGLAKAIMRFLEEAYGDTVSARPYGYGKVDDLLDVDAPPAPTPPPSPKEEDGDWQLVLSGSNPSVKVYREAGGGGGVIAELPRGETHHSTLRKGNFYRVYLPDGTPGWIHVNLVVAKL